MSCVPFVICSASSIVFISLPVLIHDFIIFICLGVPSPLDYDLPKKVSAHVGFTFNPYA